MDKVRSAFLLVLFSSIVFAITSPYREGCPENPDL